ncbi:electron transfer flavoprotein subunit beta [Verminephrobacter aporrectodeae subsp. tuberculatae]|uniref:hypothetical protein n=1 Tax=Verminephrobacter aporrectodeae TaxID=1110389 RepID=UPI002243AEFF|nr:hypothetical protein [Verminephrobacter aporrectodeae]MCW8165466.1 electron transfer flavoprotein subunit beta [Verminephrobacter aporrectodeae subsp. tuberculatae]MCW8170034.1 electron transfer flavoprotein subunit beta [Verminephrobacter aporrectodeae subsp. tuberculatae]
MNTAATVTVLIAARIHPVSQRPTRCPADATAVALALGLSLPVRLLSAGDMPHAVAHDYLALGARLIEIRPCADAALLFASLLPAVRATDWVLTGTRAPADRGSAVLPHALAAALQRPLVTDVLALEPEGPEGRACIVTQALPQGARRRLRVQAPAVLAVSAAATVQLRHSLAAAQAGRIERIAPTPGPCPDPPPGERVPAGQRRRLLEARSVQSGHSRMLGAIESAAPTGGRVIEAGDPGSKAQAVLDYLRNHSLVSF